MEIINSYAKELRAKLGRIAYFTNHGPSIGVYHEEIFRNFLKELLPVRFSIRTGFLFDPATQLASKQTDVLIIDENDPGAYFFKYGDFAIANPRAVILGIEIKTQLSYRTFLEIVHQAFDYRRVSPKKGQLLAFCFNGTRFQPERLHQWFQRITDVPDDIFNYPNTITVMEKDSLSLIPPARATPPGLYRIHPAQPDSDLAYYNTAHFLATIIKLCEAHAGISSNPFETYTPDYPSMIDHSCFRYGIGMTPGKISNGA